MKTYKIVRSNTYILELQRLENSGNRLLTQRLNAIREEEVKLQQNPLDVNNKLYGLGNYMAAKPLAQIRLYYEVVGDNVHIVWVNDEDCLHDLSNGQDRDPCNVKFISLFNNNKLDQFQEPEKTETETFRMTGIWFTDENFQAKLESKEKYSDATLQFQKNSKDEYSIINLSVTPIDPEYLASLLSHTIESAKSYKVSLYYELILLLNAANVTCQKEALKQSGFTSHGEADDIEIWTFP